MDHTVSHQYASVGHYQVEVVCTNWLDLVSFSDHVSVQVPITNFGLDAALDLTHTGADLTIPWTIDAGSNVTFTASTTSTLMLGDVNYVDGDTQGHVVIPAGYDVGVYDVTVVAENDVSRVALTTRVAIYEAVTGLTLDVSNPYTTINTDIHATANITTGTNVTWLWNWTDVARSSVGSDSGVQTASDSHQYPDVGERSLVLTVSNPVSSMTTYADVGTQTPLSDVTLHVTHMGRPVHPVTFTIETTATTPPTDAVYDFWTGDGAVLNAQSASTLASGESDAVIFQVKHVVV